MLIAARVAGNDGSGRLSGGVILTREERPPGCPHPLGTFVVRVGTSALEGGHMKYLLEIYPDGGMEAFERMSADEQQAIVEEYRAIHRAPEVIGGDQLQPAETATTVRVKDGETLLTDGPFVDAKEHLGGYCLVEADDLDVALEIAARIPAARMGGAVEVRPLVER
jgi:hypothetical protein